MGELITPEKVKPGILYLDTREDIKETQHFSSLFSELCTVPLQIAQLKTGDVVFGDICFERKTISDFVGSILGNEKDEKGRIFSQSERMLKSFRKQYVFVTQTLDDYKGNVHRHCILGGLARMLANGITVCFGISNDEDYVYLVLKTLEKEQKIRMLTTKPKSKPKEPEQPVETDVFVGIVQD